MSIIMTIKSYLKECKLDAMSLALDQDYTCTDASRKPGHQCAYAGPLIRILMIGCNILCIPSVHAAFCGYRYLKSNMLVRGRRFRESPESVSTHVLSERDTA